MSPFAPLEPLAARPSRWPFLAAILLGGVFAWGISRRGTATLLDPGATDREVAPRGDLTAAEKNTIEIFRRVSPSVVFISTTRFGRSWFSRDVMEIAEGTGSGFVWDENGTIVTNYHVVARLPEREGRARVSFTEGDAPFEAQLVGYEADKDLAVLKVDAPKKLLRPIPVGTSKDLQVGQQVLAIGNPFGFDHSLTTGIISALDREIRSVSGRPIQGVIQTDAAINPGNSGGPLLDSSGRLIGVNAAIFAPVGTNAGIGFAIPADTVNRIVPQILRSGRVVRAGLGVVLLPDAIARQLGVDGILFHQASEGGGAEAAGLRPTRIDERGRVALGDVLVAVDGTKVSSGDDLYRVLDGHGVGDRVTVAVDRDGKRREISVTLRALP